MAEDQQASMPYYQPMIMPSEKGSMLDKIDPGNVVESIKQRLMGKEYDINKQEWITPSWKTKGLTEQGASEVTSMMFPVSSKNTAISKLSDSEIRERTRSIHRAVILSAISNWKEWGIVGPDQIWMISQIVVSNTFITLKQNENAGVRELIKGTTSEIRSYQDNGQKQGVISSIFRR